MVKFKKGDTVYMLKLSKNKLDKSCIVKEGTVISVGNKYVTVSRPLMGRDMKFETNNNYLEYYDTGCSEYQLFASEDEAMEERERQNLIASISSRILKMHRSHRYYDEDDISLDILRTIECMLLYRVIPVAKVDTNDIK